MESAVADRYVVMSNGESGFGRYDVMPEPREAYRDSIAINKSSGKDAIILEFKVQDVNEKNLSDTVQADLRQIEERNYQACLLAHGISEDHIRKYGFAFCEKEVLIGAIGKE